MKRVLVVRPRFRIQVIAAGARGAAGSGGAEVDQLRAMLNDLAARVASLEVGSPTPTIPANALTDQNNTPLTNSGDQILTTGEAT